jgi:hypothetical protein
MGEDSNVADGQLRKRAGRRLSAFFGLRGTRRNAASRSANELSSFASLWISTVFAFVATFAGVLVAQKMSDSAREREERTSYRTLISMMAMDCERNAALNAAVDPGSTDRNLRPTVFLFSAALQNALLFKYMDSQQLASLIELMTMTGQSIALYSAFMNIPRLAYPVPQGPQDEPQVGEDRYAYSNRMLAKGQADTRAAALLILKKVSTEQKKLCELLRTEEALASSFE